MTSNTYEETGDHFLEEDPPKCRDWSNCQDRKIYGCDECPRNIEVNVEVEPPSRNQADTQSCIT